MNQKLSHPKDALAKLASVEDSSTAMRFLQHIQRFPPDGSIYHVGGGNGFVSKGLTERGFSSIVVEPDPTVIAISNSRAVHSIHGVPQDLPDTNRDRLGLELAGDVVEQRPVQVMCHKGFAEMDEGGALGCRL